MGALNTARWWHQAHPATAISGMMVAARSRSAASGGKNSVHTNGDGGTNEMAKRNGRRAIVTAKCAGDNGS